MITVLDSIMDAETATYGSEDVRVLSSDTADKRDVALSTRLGRNEWLAAEQPLSPTEKVIIEALRNLGNGTATSAINTNIVVMGNDMYMSCRDMLNTSSMSLVGHRKIVRPKESKKTTSPTEQTKPKGPKGSKKGRSGVRISADEIRLKNGMDRAKKMISETIASFNSHKLEPSAAFASDILEIRGIGLLYAAWFVQSHNHLYSQNYEVTYGLIIAIDRFIKTCEKLPCKSITGIVSKTDDEKMSSNKSTESVGVFMANELVSDLDALLQILVAAYNYSGEHVLLLAPTLLGRTDFDAAIPRTEIRPRQHQIDLYNAVSRFHDNGYCLTYTSQIGSGKTTAVVVLAGWVMEVRRRKGFKNFQLLFVCNNLGVRDYASQLCYNAQIPFAIGSRHKDEKLGLFKVTYHNSCVKKDGTDCIVIIADPDSAYEILMAPDSMEENEKILFLDEPTIGADTADSPSLRSNIRLMMAQPKRTVYCSATFPSVDLLQQLFQYQKLRHPGIELSSVYSSEIYIGCTIFTYENELVIPYMGVKTQAELKTIIQAVHDNPMLGRSYVTKVAYALWKAMTCCKIAGVPNIDDYFLDFENLRTDKPRQIVETMLALLATQPDEIIETVCRSALTDDLLKVDPPAAAGAGAGTGAGVVVDELGIEWSSAPDGDDIATDPISAQKLGTTQAYRFLGTSLIASDDPVQFARVQFAPLLDMIKASPLPRKTASLDEVERHIENAERLILCYSQEVAIHEKAIESLIRNTTRASDIPDKHERPDVACDRKMASKLHKVTRDIKGDGLLSGRLQAHQAIAPVYHFPEWGQINTGKHIQKFARSHSHAIVPSFVRRPIPLHTINFGEFTVNDDLILLLMAGVGIYSVALDDPLYRSTVLSLASAGQLAYLIADESICFGTNYPINHVIIAHDFNHSLCTCLQALGRAGRPGKSPTADAIVPKSFAEALIAYTRNPTAPTRESINMMAMFNKLFAEKRANVMSKVSALPHMRGKLASILATRTSPTSSPSKPVVVEDTKEADDDAVDVVTTVSSSTAVWGADDDDAPVVASSARTMRIQDLIKREETQHRPNVSTTADISSDWRSGPTTVPATAPLSASSRFDRISSHSDRATFSDWHRKTDVGPAGAGSAGSGMAAPPTAAPTVPLTAPPTAAPTAPVKAKYVPPALRGTGTSAPSRGTTAPTTHPDHRSGSNVRSWRS